MDTPPKTAAWPDLINDELPLLTETVGEPAIPLLQEPLPLEPQLAEPLEQAPLQAAPQPVEPPPAPLAPPLAPAPVSRPAAASDEAMPMAQIERELQAAARLIMQEVIDDYMLQIEAELHRRLEDHLSKILRAGRR